MLPESPIFISYSKFLSFHLQGQDFSSKGWSVDPFDTLFVGKISRQRVKIVRAFFFFFKLWTNEPFDREYSTLFKKFLSKKEYYNKISRDRTLNRIVVTFTIIRVKICFVSSEKKKRTRHNLFHTLGSPFILARCYII